MEWMEWILVKAQPEEWREIWEAPQGTGGDGDRRAALSTDSIGSDYLSQIHIEPRIPAGKGHKEAVGGGPGLDLPDLNRYTHSHHGF